MNFYIGISGVKFKYLPCYILIVRSSLAITSIIHYDHIGIMVVNTSQYLRIAVFSKELWQLKQAKSRNITLLSSARGEERKQQQVCSNNELNSIIYAWKESPVVVHVNCWEFLSWYLIRFSFEWKCANFSAVLLVDGLWLKCTRIPTITTVKCIVEPAIDMTC